jgi:hypothetical protein
MKTTELSYKLTVPRRGHESLLDDAIPRGKIELEILKGSVFTRAVLYCKGILEFSPQTSFCLKIHLWELSF